MEHRQLGGTDLRPSLIGFGCVHIANPAVDRREITATLHRAIEEGVNFFDTSDSYGRGKSERLLGEIVHGRRDRLILCTKAGILRGPADWARVRAGKMMRRLLGGSSSPGAVEGRRKNFEPGYIRRAVERSLRRLGTDYIDLLQLHDPPLEPVRNGALHDTLRSLRKDGLIRYYGVAASRTADRELVDAYLRVPGVAAIQLPVSLTVATHLPLPAPAKELGVGLVARAPFDGGRLFANPEVMAILSRDPSRTPAQAAIRYVAGLEDASVVLTGIANRRELDENIAALSVPDVGPDELREIRALFQR